MSSKEKFQEILKNLSEFDKEKIYRMVWYDHVCEDVENLTLNYYQNLHNLTTEEMEEYYVSTCRII